MTVNRNSPEPADRHYDLDELRASSSPHVIEFFTARDQIPGDSNDSIELLGQWYESKSIRSRQELSHPLFDPMEEWLHSLISGAALILLLIGILCLPNANSTKTERLQPPLVSCPRSTRYFTGGQLAVFQGANEAPISESYGSSEQRGKTANWPRPKGL